MQATTCHFSIVGYRNLAVDGRALAINFYVPSVIHPKVVLPQKVQISIRVKAHRSLFLVRFLFSLGHKTLRFSPLMFKGFVIGFCTHKHWTYTRLRIIMYYKEFFFFGATIYERTSCKISFCVFANPHKEDRWPKFFAKSQLE